MVRLSRSRRHQLEHDLWVAFHELYDLCPSLSLRYLGFLSRQAQADLCLLRRQNQVRLMLLEAV